MSYRLPESIQVIESDGGVSFRLPPQRSLPWGGWPRVWRVVLMVALVLGSGIALLAWPMLTGPYPPETTGSGFKALLMGSVGIGMLLMLVGGLLAYHVILDHFGHVALHVDDQTLRKRYRLGPLRSGSKSWPLWRIQKLKVTGPPLPPGRDSPDWEDRSDRLLDLPTILVAEFKFDRVELLATYYPVRLLAPLADALAERINRDRRDPPPPGRFPPVQVRHGSPEEEPAEPAPGHAPTGDITEATPTASVEEALPVPDSPTPPPGSHVRAEHDEGRLTLTFPPHGYTSKRSLSNLGSALFMFLLAGGFVFLLVMPESGGDWTVMAILGLVLMVLCLAFFSLGGLMLLWSYFNEARSTTIIDATENFLLISESGLLRTRQDQWERDQLRAIEIGDLGLRDQPLPHLEIKTEDGPRWFFAGHEEAELHWIADLLRRKLRLPNAGRG